MILELGIPPQAVPALPQGRRWALGAIIGSVALFSCLFTASLPAQASLLKPPHGKRFFGVTDTGTIEGFRDFASTVGKHPAVIQTFHPWGNSLGRALPRWRSVHARPMLHISTTEDDGTEVITPRGIAMGRGDGYLIYLNHVFHGQKLRGYIRPLGEPNRCLNAWAGVDCSGNARSSRYSSKWYRQAFRRMYLLLHGGATKSSLNRRLAGLGLPKINGGGKKPLPDRFPSAPLAVVWSTLPAGSPRSKGNWPARYFPGAGYVDWVGTDFYSRYAYWNDLARFYKRFAKHYDKPLALTEFGVWGTDSPAYVKRLFTWTNHRTRARMLVYYQDFGTLNAFRIQNFPLSRSVLARRISSRRFPPLAPHPPEKPVFPGGINR